MESNTEARRFYAFRHGPQNVTSYYGMEQQECHKGSFTPLTLYVPFIDNDCASKGGVYVCTVLVRRHLEPASGDRAME